MAKKIIVKIGLGKYASIEMNREEALSLLEKMFEKLQKDDIREAIRIIENFEPFYELMQRKHKDYLPLPHDYSDLIRGSVVIDKLRLTKTQGEEKVLMVFDRRFPIDELRKFLEENGYEVEVMKTF